MPSPFYFITETYGGSEILISVERDASTFESTFGTVSLCNIIGKIDGVEKVNENAPRFTIDGRPGLADRLPQIAQDLRNEIDALDELDVLMTELGYSGGSDTVEGYTVTAGPGAGQFTHDWVDDPDFDIESIEQATLADYSDASNIHNGPLTPPITDSGYTAGNHRYFQIRGTRTGYAPGPWSRDDAVAT